MPGTLLQKRYQIIRELGAGGMGAVYQANDLRLGRVVAVKENSGADPRQFQQEALLLANLNHPNLPNVSDHFIEPSSGAQYLVMDFIEGEDLQVLMQRQGALPEAQALAWLDQILDAVAYLHSRGVIHRDIKPGNIKLTPQGKAVLVDFGIAKVYQPGQLTATGARMGTPGYASPEQNRGGTDQRSDVYSLGATLYALLTGQEPPDAPSLLSGSAVLAPPRALNPALSVQTERTILAAMAVQPDQRFQSVDDMRRALKGMFIAPTVAIPVPVPSPTRKRTAMTFALLAGMFALLGIVGGIGWIIAASPTPTPRLGLALETRTAMATQARVVPTDTAIPTPTITAIPIPSITAQPTAIPTPSITTAPTAIATPQLRPPTATPRAAGPPGRIAFISQGGISVMNADGTESRQVWKDPSTGESSASVFAIAWSPDGRMIVFKSDVSSGGPSDYKWIGSDLWVINDDGTNPRRLTSKLATIYNNPAWSPDGRLIAFVSSLERSGSRFDGSMEIYVMDSADGANVKRLTYSGSNNLSQKAEPNWSPDGRSIVFAFDPDGSNWDIYVINADGTNPRRLTSNPAYDRSPAWSPDGRSIAFQSNRDGNWEIYVMNADGSNPRRITNNPASDMLPTWSPDSRVIAFISEREENRTEIYVMDADGGNVRRLTYSRNSSRYPAWSPR